MQHQSYEFYSARATEAGAEAAEATLDNVRERALRAQKTWLGLAEQARRVANDREKARLARELKDAEGQ